MLHPLSFFYAFRSHNMFSFQATQTRNIVPVAEETSFQQVEVNITGRLMLESHDEFDCTIKEMSPGDARVVCSATPRKGERIIAYMDHIGRLEGLVLSVTNTTFLMSINATARKREKLAAQLTWIANRHELGLPEDRRHDRLTPRNTRVELVMEDGARFPCRLMDLSLSGAAVDIDIRPPLGTPVRLGNMKGRIVRHFMEGVALEFASVQSRETLREFL